MPSPAGDDADAIERWEVQLRKGYLDLAILACLWSERLYGLEILRRLADVAGLEVAEGTVYPLLNRLKVVGWLDSEWVEAQAGHPRKYYRLTATGRRHLVRMARSWSSFAASLEGLLRPVREERR
jgi:PadR family transcriptional regulator PadR